MIRPTTLTATQMIAELEALVEEHGDVPVHIRFRGYEEEALSVYPITTAGEQIAIISNEGEPG